MKEQTIKKSRLNRSAIATPEAVREKLLLEGVSKSLQHADAALERALWGTPSPAHLLRVSKGDAQSCSISFRLASAHWMNFEMASSSFSNCHVPDYL